MNCSVKMTAATRPWATVTACPRRTRQLPDPGTDTVVDRAQGVPTPQRRPPPGTALFCPTARPGLTPYSPTTGRLALVPTPDRPWVTAPRRPT